MIAPAEPSGGCRPSRMTLMRLVGVSPVAAVLSVSLTPPKGRGRVPSWQLPHGVGERAAPVSLLGGSAAALSCCLGTGLPITDATYAAIACTSESAAEARFWETGAMGPCASPCCSCQPLRRKVCKASAFQASYDCESELIA